MGDGSALPASTAGFHWVIYNQMPLNPPAKAKLGLASSESSASLPGTEEKGGSRWVSELDASLNDSWLINPPRPQHREMQGWNPWKAVILGCIDPKGFTHTLGPLGKRFWGDVCINRLSFCCRSGRKGARPWELGAF